MSAENSLLQKVKKWAKSTLPGVLRKNHGSVYTGSGWPDIEYHEKGCTIFVELKAPGKDLSKPQKAKFKELRKAGMTCEKVDNMEWFVVVVSRWRRLELGER